ncbi:MAG: C25 family cysteine peptidase [Bacillota bacterium]
MKKQMRTKLIIVFLLMFVFTQYCFVLSAMEDDMNPHKPDKYVGEKAVMDIKNKANDVNVTVLESDLNHTVVRFDVNNFSKNSVIIDGKEHYTISCDGTGSHYDRGKPDLPRISRSIIIPGDSDVKLKVISSEYEDYKNFPIAPSKGTIMRTEDPKDVSYSFGHEYKNGHFYPAELAVISEPFIMRELRGATITLNAFQYRPAGETLRVYTSVTVEIVSEGKSTVNTLKSSSAVRITKDFEAVYANTFINYENFRKSEMSVQRDASETGSMLIISYDSFSSAMDPFIQWKNSNGISTTLVNISTVSPGNNSTEIKNYIQNYYNQNPNLTYVLLVGDYAQVSSPAYSDGVSDPTYTKVAGSDNYPDIYVGRFSAETIEDVQTQIDRTIEFEQNGYNTADWFKKGIGIASDEGSGETDREHMDIIKNKLLNDGYTLVDSIYDPGASASSVSNSLNQGRGIINYCGHGAETYWVTSGFSNSDIQNLQNPGQLPFIISVSCVSGRFHTGTCFAEAWLRSENNSGSPIGAIGTLMSTVNQPWTPPMVGQDGIIDVLCAGSRISLGGICYAGQTPMIQNGTSDDLLTFHTWTLFGDPSIQILPEGETPATDPYEPNNTMSEAYSIDSGADYESFIYSVSDVDYYTFTINQTGVISATLTNLPYDYDLYLYNSAGTQVAYSYNGSTANESINYTATSTGNYYLKVIGYNGAYSQSVKYKLNSTYPTGSGGEMQWYYENKTYDTPHKYPNNYNATHEYIKSGATMVAVHFSRFETEKNYDYVYIKDKNGNTVSTHHGTLSPFWATVDGDKISINLVTDYSITKYGYTIDQVAYYSGSQLVIENVNITGGNL